MKRLTIIEMNEKYEEWLKAKRKGYTFPECIAEAQLAQDKADAEAEKRAMWIGFKCWLGVHGNYSSPKNEVTFSTPALDQYLKELHAKYLGGERR